MRNYRLLASPRWHAINARAGAAFVNSSPMEISRGSCSRSTFVIPRCDIFIELCGSDLIFADELSTASGSYLDSDLATWPALQRSNRPSFIQIPAWLLFFSWFRENMGADLHNSCKCQRSVATNTPLIKEYKWYRIHGKKKICDTG